MGVIWRHTIGSSRASTADANRGPPGLSPACGHRHASSGWRGPPAVGFEAVRALEPPGRETANALPKRPDRVLTVEQVASSIDPQAPGALANTIRARIARINQFAKAFGRLPVIDVHDDGYLMRSSVAELILEALSDPQSVKTPQTGH